MAPHLTYPIRDSWHITPSHNLFTFFGWLLWSSLRPIIPMLLSFFLSFSTVSLQVVFVLPLLLFPSGTQAITVLQLLFWSCISICPIIIYAVVPLFS